MVKKKTAKKAVKKAAPKKAVHKNAAKKKAAIPTTIDLKKIGKLTRALTRELELAARREPELGDYGGICLFDHPDSPVPERRQLSRETCIAAGGRWQPNNPLI